MCKSKGSVKSLSIGCFWEKNSGFFDHIQAIAVVVRSDVNSHVYKKKSHVCEEHKLPTLTKQQHAMLDKYSTSSNIMVLISTLTNNGWSHHLAKTCTCIRWYITCVIRKNKCEEFLHDFYFFSVLFCQVHYLNIFVNIAKIALQRILLP